MNLQRVSVTVLTCNNETTIGQLLHSLELFGEVLLMDSGSVDRTLDIAAAFPNVTIKKTTFDGFGPVHNRASEAATHDWILSIDSDEVASPALVEELSELDGDPSSVYAVPRHNYYRQKHIRHSGWYPDYQWRLYCRKQTRFTDAQVHEQVITKGMNRVRLRSPILHYSYKDTSDFLAKMQSYSTLFANQNQGRSSSLSKAIIHGIYTFFRCYLLKMGILDGKEGFIIAVYNANTAFYKYLKLADY